MLDENAKIIDTDNAGAVWKKMSKSGNTYFSGCVAGKNVIMFLNKTDNTKAPTYVFKYQDDKKD